MDIPRHPREKPGSMSDLVLTLIATGVPARAALPGRIAAIADALGAQGIRAGGPDWLDPGIACDIALAAAPLDRARALIAPHLAGHTIDAGVQPAAGRRKRLLLADMESTIIAEEMLDELADLRGLRPQIAEITRRAMEGQIDFRAALRERVGLLAGLPQSALDIMAERITINPGAAVLVATMRAHGATCALVSGGFDFFTRRVAAMLGFDIERANTLLVADGHLTGAVAEPIRDRDDKLSTLRALAAERDLGDADVAAIGDGANDIPMLKAAGLGVAYHAKPAVRAAVPVRLDHSDLTGLLYLQGYRRDDFVEPGMAPTR